MKKRVFVITLLCFVFAMLAGCEFSPSPSHSPSSSTLEGTPDPETAPSQPKIKDNISEIDNNVLKQIALSYFIIFDFDQYFAEQDVMDYGRAYQYMTYAGIYRMNPLNIWERPDLMQYYDEKSDTVVLPAEIVDALILEGKIDPSELTESMMVDDNYVIDNYFWSIRPELYPYFNKETGVLTVPAEVVDGYISDKFNTIIDHAQTEEYDEASNTYTFAPFEGDFYYNLSIESMTVKDNVVRFNCLAVLDEAVQKDPRISHEVLFTIMLTDGEYRYLSVEITDNENS